MQLAKNKLAKNFNPILQSASMRKLPAAHRVAQQHNSLVFQSSASRLCCQAAASPQGSQQVLPSFERLHSSLTKLSVAAGIGAVELSRSRRESPGVPCSELLSKAHLPRPEPLHSPPSCLVCNSAPVPPAPGTAPACQQATSEGTICQLALYWPYTKPAACNRHQHAALRSCWRQACLSVTV